MPERTLLRVGGIAGIAGAGLTIVFNILHPRAAQFEDITAQLHVTKAVEEVTLALVATALIVLFGITPLTFGVAIIASDVVGLPWAASAPSFPPTPIVRIVSPPFITLMTLWMLNMGAQMVQRARQVT